MHTKIKMLCFGLGVFSMCLVPDCLIGTDLLRRSEVRREVHNLHNQSRLKGPVSAVSEYKL